MYTNEVQRRLSTLLLVIAASILAQDAPKGPYTPTSEEMTELAAKAKELEQKLAAVKGKADFADAAIYLKAAQWAIKYAPKEFYSKNDYKSALAGLATGMDRATQLAKGEKPWTQAKGRLSRAYVSRVDGSLQPYGLIIPGSYQAGKPIRLDVNLHGRGATLTEVNFLASHDSSKALPPDQDFIQLDVFGRTNNAYRWAGETDVLEAVAAVQSQYSIDPDRIVLRGFSMGGAGAWHIGLHFPGSWAAMEAGAGFTETMKYAKVKDPREPEKAAMHIYDAVDYAANAAIVPTVGYGGEIDPQLAASQNIKLELERLGVKPPQILFLVGPQTAHKFHPDSKKLSDAFIEKNLPRKPLADFTFVTYTPRYGNLRGFTVDALETLYEQATLSRKGTKFITANIRSLELDTTRTVTLDGETLTGKQFNKREGKWVAGKVAEVHKRRGLQGPIDDAFMDAFLCVYAGTKPKELEAFAAIWSKYMRGELPMKEAAKVNKTDMETHNLILWGTPNTNPIIGQVAAKLPIRWANGQFTVAGQNYSEKQFTLQMIAPNPLAPTRYVVLNTGHSFGEKEFIGTNALLYPRKGDWAIVRKESGEIAASGLFNSNWKLQ